MSTPTEHVERQIQAAREGLRAAAMSDPAIRETRAFKRAERNADDAERCLGRLGVEGLNAAGALAARAREAAIACLTLTHWST